MTRADEEDDGGSSALGWAGLVAGLLGLAAGGLALARTRSTRDPAGATGVVASGPAPGDHRPGRARAGLSLVLAAGRRRPPRTPSWSAPIPRRGPSSRPPPRTVTLTFDEPVRLTSQEVAVYDAEGDPVAATARASGVEVAVGPGRCRRPGRRDLRRVVERPLRATATPSRVR